LSIADIVLSFLKGQVQSNSPQQVRQLDNVHGDAARLVPGQQVGGGLPLVAACSDVSAQGIESTAAVAPRNSPHMLKSQTALFAAARQGLLKLISSFSAYGRYLKDLI
jgi:hypothetical protein